MHPGRNREHERVAEKSVGKVVERVGRVLLLSGRRIQLGHPVENLRAPGIAEDTGENDPSRAGGRGQLACDRDTINDHG